MNINRCSYSIIVCMYNNNNNNNNSYSPLSVRYDACAALEAKVLRKCDALQTFLHSSHYIYIYINIASPQIFATFHKSPLYICMYTICMC